MSRPQPGLVKIVIHQPKVRLLPIGKFSSKSLPREIFLGQLDFTHELDQKLVLFEQFWDPEKSTLDRLAFLDEWGITHVFSGTYEASFQSEPLSLPGEVVYERDGITIIEVGSTR